jgi:hypothetical protein
MHEKVAMVGSALLSRRTLQVVTYTMVGKILHLTILLFPSHCTFFLTTIMYNFFLEGWKLPMVIYYFRKLKKRSPNKVRYKAVRIYWIRKYWIRKYVNESRNIDSTKASKLSPIYTHTRQTLSKYWTNKKIKVVIWTREGAPRTRLRRSRQDGHQWWLVAYRVAKRHNAEGQKDRRPPPHEHFLRKKAIRPSFIEKARVF